jgi:hypothetical protein
MVGWVFEYVLFHLPLKRCSFCSLAAMRDFAKAKDQWYSTWPQNVEDRAMVMYVLTFLSHRSREHWLIVGVLQ